MKRSFEFLQQTFADPVRVRELALQENGAASAASGDACHAVRGTQWWTPSSRIAAARWLWLDTGASDTAIADHTGDGLAAAEWMAVVCLSTWHEWSGSAEIRPRARPIDEPASIAIAFGFNDLLIVNILQHQLILTARAPAQRMLAHVLFVTDAEQERPDA